MDYLQITYLFLLGTIFGSFLNVVIYRLPKGMSLIKPASQCSHCNTPIKWYENIPVFSYVFLKGKCANCKKKISLLYPTVEILNGILFVIIAVQTSGLFQFITFAIITMLFLCLIFIDFKNYILPDVLLVLIFLTGLIYFSYIESFGIIPRFFYAFITGITFFLLRFVTSKIYKKETFGLGDIKLGALIGFFVGSMKSFIAIFFGFIIAAIIFLMLIALKKVKRDTYMPFGPYIVFGMVVFLFYGEEIMHWYIHFFV